MGIGNRIGVVKAVLLLAAGAAGGGAALAVASVPDGDGTYHACVQVTTSGTATVPYTGGGPNLTMIDPGAGQHCIGPDGQTPIQTEVSWNATGPQGPPGTPGANGATGATGSPGAPGRSVTVAGGITIASPTINPRGPGLGRATLPGSGIPAFTVLGVSAAPSTGKSGAGTGKTSLHEIVITKKVDKASPKLFQACATGKHFPVITITVRKTGGKSQPYLVYTLKNATVSSYQTTPASKSDTPEESISLNFTKVEINY